jgi:hypothetical protein
VNQFAGGNGCLDALDGAIARIAHDFEYVLESGGRSGAAVSSPSDVIEHGGRPIELGPHVDQHGVAFADFAAAFGLGFIMRIRHVGIHGDDGPVIGDQTGFSKPARMKRFTSHSVMLWPAARTAAIF